MVSLYFKEVILSLHNENSLEQRGVPVPKVLCQEFSHSLVTCDYFFMERLSGATWDKLKNVKEPSLVNYDMWSKNILLDNRNNTYVIDGIIDHERAFYGDPLAEFISTITICEDITKAFAFQKGYSEVAGGFFSLNINEQIRFAMYNVYMGLLIGVEIYRYEESDIPKFLETSRYVISEGLGKIKALILSDIPCSTLDKNSNKRSV